MVEHHGWHIPASFTSLDDEAKRAHESVGIADVSWMMKFDLKGPGLVNVPALGSDTSCWVLARFHSLLTCEPQAEKAVRERLQQFQLAGKDSPAFYVTDVTSVFTQLVLAGPRSREVLNKLTSLNLSEISLGDGNCTQAGVAHVHAAVLRKDMKGIPAYHLLVSRDYGESIWDSVLHAGHEFHIAPMGLEAQRLLQG
jgi:heterotetrameric sarcosine oxidase gamma subunit